MTRLITLLLVATLAACGDRPRTVPGEDSSVPGDSSMPGDGATTDSDTVDSGVVDSAPDGDGGAVDGTTDASTPGSPHLTWAVRPAGAEYGARMGLATDGAGNVVMVDGARAFAYDATGRERFVYTLSGTTVGISDVAIDGAGNVLLACTFFDVTVGGMRLTSQGSADILLLALSSTGTYLWHRTWGTPEYDAVTRLAVDSAGNIVLLGSGGDGALSIGGATITGWEPRLPGAFGMPPVWDISSFLVSLDSTATTQRWSRALAGIQTAITDMAVRPEGAIYIGGVVRQDVDLGAGALGAPNGSSDAFVARYSSSGGCDWTRRIDAPDAASLFTLGADAAGNSYVTLLNGGRVSGMLIEEGAPTIASLDPTGADRWERSYPVRALTVSHVVGARVLLTGHHYMGVDFGDGPIATAGRDDAFVVALDTDGVLDFALPVADRTIDQGLAILGEETGDRFWVGGTVDLYDADYGTGLLPEIATGPEVFVAGGAIR